jgi:HlyD family secretion protein
MSFSFMPGNSAALAVLIATVTTSVSTEALAWGGRGQAQVRQEKAVEEANANLAQQKAQVLLAQQEMDRGSYLVQRGVSTKELLDQRQQQLDGANAALNAATARVTIAEHALEAHALADERS